MQLRLATCLATLVALSVACGGRFGTGEGGDGAGGSSDGGGARPGTGGSSSQGSTSNNGATSSSGGRPSVGGSGFAGTAMGGGFGTAGTFGGCLCPEIACPPDSRPVPNPSGCCFDCQPVCANVACPGIACGSGSHLEVLPGQCCPTCVRDLCEEQRATYQELFAQLVDKYSTLGCSGDHECTVYYEKNQCAYGCGIAMPVTAVSYLDENLNSLAQQTCAPECLPIPQPCVPPQAPRCRNGRCY